MKKNERPQHKYLQNSTSSLNFLSWHFLRNYSGGDEEFLRLCYVGCPQWVPCRAWPTFMPPPFPCSSRPWAGKDRRLRPRGRRMTKRGEAGHSSLTQTLQPLPPPPPPFLHIRTPNSVFLFFYFLLLLLVFPYLSHFSFSTFYYLLSSPSTSVIFCSFFILFLLHQLIFLGLSSSLPFPFPPSSIHLPSFLYPLSSSLPVHFPPSSTHLPQLL